MDYEEKVKLMRKNGRSQEYIMGYLDGAFDKMVETRNDIDELAKRITKKLNEEKANRILGD